MKPTHVDDAENPMLAIPQQSHSSELAETLLIAVQENDNEQITQLVLQNVELLRHEYPQYDYQKILIIACNDLHSMEKVEKATIRNLIDLGAKYNEPTKIGHWEAIHYTALNANKKKMEAIIKYLTPEEVNSLVYCCESLLEKYSFCPIKKGSKTYSNNALSILLKYGNRNGQFKECCELLIRSGINVHQADSNGVTPSDLIWKMGDNELNVILKSTKVTKQRVDNGFDLIRSNNINKFLLFHLTKEEANSVDGTNAKLSSCTLLQLCCAKGFKSCIEHLLKNGAQINKVVPKNPNFCIMIAIKEDHEDVVQLLLERQDLELPDNILLQLHILYKYTKNFDAVDKYVKVILKHFRQSNKASVQKFLVCKDELNRTPLHYATHYRCPDNIMALLSMGASLIKKDVFGNTPLDSIESNILENFFDSCIDIVQDENPSQVLEPVKNINHTYSIKINYESLIAEDEAVQEAEFLRSMSRVMCLNCLIKHPVVASFLALKWQQFKWFVYMNLMLYVVAYISLLFYGFASTKYSKVGNIFLMTAFILLVVRESIQAIIMRTRYIKRVENILDLSLIVGISYIIASGWFETLNNQSLLIAFSAVFLTSTLGIFLQLGNLSYFTVKVIILRQIAINFFKHMIFFMFPVLAFFFCFFMLSENKDNLFFQMLYETVAMFAGDPDSEFPKQFKTNPAFGHLTYLVFIILIGIILHNLLIGLAVSDLQAIQRQAEFMDTKERSKYITNIEGIIFNKYKNSVYFKSIFQKILNFLSVFKDSRVLVIQSYNWNTVYIKDNVGFRKRICNEDIIKQFKNIFKNLSLKNKEIKDPYSLKNLHEKLHKIEALMLENLNISKNNKREVPASTIGQ